MPGAGGPLWNVGGGYGYRPYTAMTHGGARRLSGLGQPPTGQGPAHIDHRSPLPPSVDPVVQVSRQVVAQLIAEARGAGREPGAAFLQNVAGRIRPGGDAYVARESQNLIRQGFSKPEALTRSLTALLANTYTNAIYTGTLPAWAPRPRGGLGLTWGEGLESVWGGFQRLLCIEGVGASAGIVASDDPEKGAEIGARSQAALAEVTQACGPPQPAQTRRRSRGPAKPEEGTSPWVWVAVGVGVFVLLGGGAVFAVTRKKKASSSSMPGKRRGRRRR